MRRSHNIDRRVSLLGWLSIAVGLVSLVNLFYSAWHQDWTYDEPDHLSWSARLLETGETERTSNSLYGSKTPVTLLNAVPFRFAQAHNWTVGKHSRTIPERAPARCDNSGHTQRLAS